MKEYLIEYLLSQTPQLLKLLPDLVLVGWVAVAVICRFNKMGPSTSNVVALQYGALFAGSVFGMGFRFVPEMRGYDFTALAAGVVVFLLLGAKRWRDGAPPGTEKGADDTPMPPPTPIDHSTLHRVAGGTKK